ncbi:hypothetical protein EXIGLDRAFT_727843, partial [Exidia glandulosa HHB12029]
MVERYALSTLDYYVPFAYVPQMLYFRCSEPDVELLRSSVEKLLARFHCLAGTLVPAPDDPRPGRLEISAPFLSVDEIFSVKDLRVDPTIDYERAQVAGEHIHLLTPGWFFAPAPAQVMRVQLTLLRGGCTLCWALHHAFVDGAGSGSVLRALATLCRGETPDELLFDRGVAAFYRPNTFPTTPTPKWEDHPEYFEAPLDAPFGMPPPCVQRVLWFSGPALVELKTLCAPSSEDPDQRWVSTNDAMAAFLWNRISVARVKAGIDPSLPSMFGMSVDARRRFTPPVSSNFTGNSTVNTVTTSALSEIASPETPLRTIALKVRESVAAMTESHILSVVALLEGMSDIRRWRQSQQNTHTSDFDVSSWAGQPTYSLDWGRAFGGEKVDRARLPWNVKPGIAWIMPAGVRIGEDSAGLEVVLMLSEEHMEILVKDEEFTRYAAV